VLYAVLPVLYQDLGLAAIEVGILLSANRWIRLLTNELAHWAATRVSARTLFAGALVLGALTTAVYASTTSFSILLMARISWGLAWSFIRHVGVGTVMANTDDAQAGRTMGWYNGISRAGSVAGLFGGALLVDWLGFHAGVLVLAVLSGLAVPLSFKAVGDTIHSKEGRRSAAPPFLLALGVSLGAVGPGFVMATVGAAIASLLDDSMRTPAATLTGALLAARYLMDSALAPLLGSSFDRYGFARAARIYFAIGGLALGLACLAADVWWFAVAIIVFFTCGTALQTGVAATASRLGSGAYARYVTASDLGSASGPLLGWGVVAVTSDPFHSIAIGGVVFALTTLVVRQPR